MKYSDVVIATYKKTPKKTPNIYIHILFPRAVAPCDLMENSKMVVAMFIYLFSDFFNIRGAICRTRKRQGVLSGHIISRRMEIL